jgi:hypothetical protein
MRGHQSPPGRCDESLTWHSPTSTPAILNRTKPWLRTSCRETKKKKRTGIFLYSYFDYWHLAPCCFPRIQGVVVILKKNKKKKRIKLFTCLFILKTADVIFFLISEANKHNE